MASPFTFLCCNPRSAVIPFVSKEEVFVVLTFLEVIFLLLLCKKAKDIQDRDICIEHRVVYLNLLK